MRKSNLGGGELAIKPFHLSKWTLQNSRWYRNGNYLLVIVDHLPHWVEAFPVIRATANSVVKIWLEQIIPRFGICLNVDSDHKTHFTFWIIQNIAEKLE